MFSFLLHHYNRFAQYLHEQALPRKRSTHWKTVEKMFLKLHPSCEACGTTKHLQVHHIRAFHTNPELELSIENLITLCMLRNFECHYIWGHLGRGGWKYNNALIREDIELLKSGKVSWDEQTKVILARKLQ
jgi:5-methylcytosine-specific restriction endonuclease McrA